MLFYVVFAINHFVLPTSTFPSSLPLASEIHPKPNPGPSDKHTETDVHPSQIRISR